MCIMAKKKLLTCFEQVADKILCTKIGWHSDLDGFLHKMNGRFNRLEVRSENKYLGVF